MFNTTWRESSPADPQTYGDLPDDSFATLLRTGFDYGNHKFSIVQNLLPRAGIYGLAAAAKGMGFAADGSYRYGTVALALSEYFDVPPENLVVQGYGEEYLKIPTLGDERDNRRASVRRITDLLASAQ